MNFSFSPRKVIYKQFKMTNVSLSTGIPSIPVVDYATSSGSIQFNISSEFSGIAESVLNSSFNFIIEITSNKQKSFNYSYSFPDYIANSSKSIKIPLPEGVYIIEIRAQNMHGISESFQLGPIQVFSISNSSTIIYSSITTYHQSHLFTTIHITSTTLAVTPIPSSSLTGLLCE